MAKSSDSKSPKNRRPNLINSTLRGRWLSTRFFGRHWGIILAFMVLIMIYITNRYQCVTAMETIQSLEKDLQVVRSERIREKSYYMSGIRESAMHDRLQRLGLQLEVREQPPYKLFLEENP